jgi:hypothetical protein
MTHGPLKIYANEFADPAHLVIRCHDSNMVMTETEHEAFTTNDGTRARSDRIMRRCPVCGAVVMTSLIAALPDDAEVSP